MLEVEVRETAGGHAGAGRGFSADACLDSGSYLVREFARHVQDFQQRILPDALCSGKRRTKTPGAS